MAQFVGLTKEQARKKVLESTPLNDLNPVVPVPDTNEVLESVRVEKRKYERRG